MINISIAKDFSLSPGPRYIHQGKYSGELFRTTILTAKYLEAKEKKSIIHVDLDGTFGYLLSFLEESFGGLVRETGDNPEEVLKFLTFKSNDELVLIDKIKQYIREANINGKN
jgi:hypothetical protein